jgi:hypothetical protein
VDLAGHRVDELTADDCDTGVGPPTPDVGAPALRSGVSSLILR